MTTAEPSAEALPIWAVNRATEIASAFEYALNIWERDAIAREIDAAYRRGWESGREDAAQAVKDMPRCPFDEKNNLKPEDPCPICGDTGDEFAASPPNCRSPLLAISALAPPQEGS